MRYDEVGEQRAIDHALRFTCPRTRKAYVSPARHYASSDTSSALPPMGMRVRLKASFDITGFSPNVRVILRAMKKYGMFVADNGSGMVRERRARSALERRRPAPRSRACPSSGIRGREVGFRAWGAVRIGYCNDFAEGPDFAEKRFLFFQESFGFSGFSPPIPRNCSSES